jgi:hypothetical protein
LPPVGWKGRDGADAAQVRDAEQHLRLRPVDPVILDAGRGEVRHEPAGKLEPRGIHHRVVDAAAPHLGLNRAGHRQPVRQEIRRRPLQARLLDRHDLLAEDLLADEHRLVGVGHGEHRAGDLLRPAPQPGDLRGRLVLVTLPLAQHAVRHEQRDVQERDEQADARDLQENGQPARTRRGDDRRLRRIHAPILPGLV